MQESELLEWMKPEALSEEERVVAMSIFLLNCILDGDMGLAQMDLWEQLVLSASDIAVLDKKRIYALTTRFREFDVITAKDLHDCFDRSVPPPVKTCLKHMQSKPFDWWLPICCVHF